MLELEKEYLSEDEGSKDAEGSLDKQKGDSSDSSENGEDVTLPGGPEETEDNGKMSSSSGDTRVPRRKRFIPKYEVDGVAKVILDEETQIEIGVCVGPDVNSQRPWKVVQKTVLLNRLEQTAEACPYYHLKDEIEKFPEEDILIGYIPDESRDTDDFYICYTVEAKNHCQQQSDRFIRRQEKKIQKSLQRKVRPWKTLGSENEIKEEVIVNTRPLLEVEIKTCFPKIKDPSKLWIRDTNCVRDGYIELTPYRVKYNNFLKRRISLATQVAPPTTTKEMQTVLRYPQNKWTQVETEAPQVAEAKKKKNGGNPENPEEDNDDDESESGEEEEEKDMFATPKVKQEDAYQIAARKLRRPSYVKSMNSFVYKNGEKIENILIMNSIMDIYCNDYPKLSKTLQSDHYDSMEFEEYVCFTDITAKNKFVGSAVFHPMWAGIVAIAYTDGCSGILTSRVALEDPIKRAVYGLNPVMIWSHTDTLRPKLCLESNREVKTLSFCPFDENVLIGGCINGQVVIWDLTGKLEKIESVETLTETRQKYRIAMNAHMGWMKQIHDDAVVPSTVVSNLQYSHSGAITSIQWLSPNVTLDVTGKLELLDKYESRTKIFMTGSEDGTILIWNMNTDKVISNVGKKVKRSRRIAKKPSALALEESPWKILDRVFQPCHRLILGKAGNPNVMHIQSLGLEPVPVEYFYVPSKKELGRKYFDCNILAQKDIKNQGKIHCGSMGGEFGKVMWEGLVVNTGELINTEYANMPNKLNFHDGVVSTISINPFMNDLILTIGGTVLAFWRDELSDGPLMWKKRNTRLTSGVWSNYKPSLFYVSTIDGIIESWDLLCRSDVPINMQTLSGVQLTSTNVHTLPLKQNLLGVSDSNGSFRMFLKPPLFMLKDDNFLTQFDEFIKRELSLKLNFIAWQKEWTEKNLSQVLAKKREEEALQREKDEEIKRQRDELEAQLAREEEELLSRKVKVITPEERWKRIINKLIEKTIAVKKMINKAELLEQERPLRELEAQRLEKERRMMERMKNQKTIFSETVAILFPEAVPKPPKTDTCLPVEERKRQKSQFIESFKTLSRKYEELVDKQPYKSTFSWNNAVAEGKERRQALDMYGHFILKHKERLAQEAAL